MNRRTLLGALCLMAIGQTAPAPLYNGFGTLDQLIEGAQIILVADIVKGAADLDFGGGGIYGIEIAHPIKGDAKSGRRATAYLRDLHFRAGPTKSASLTEGFRVGQRYLLFLNKTGSGFKDEEGKSPAADFECENSEGDAVWISSPNFFKLESLKGKSVRESVVALLRHTGTQQQNFATAISAMVESRRTAFDPRTTPILFCENNAEETAKFYVSIFSDPKRPYPTGRSTIERIVRHHDGPEIKVTAVVFLLDDQPFMALNRGPQEPTADSRAFLLNCGFEDETRFFRERLSAGGKECEGGWITDKFGVAWNFGPNGIEKWLGGMMSEHPNSP